MNRISPTRLGLAALALLGTTLLGQAQIERLTLEQMVTKTDDAVLGEITKKEVIRIDHPVDGPELYYTHLTIEGRSLVDGKATKAVVTFPGGFIDAEHGVWYSEAPSEAETELGTEVVAFYKWSDNMGGDLEGNALYASHGGIFRTVTSRKGAVVLGKGDGYAVANNIAISSLDEKITSIDAANKQGK